MPRRTGGGAVRRNDDAVDAVLHEHGESSVRRHAVRQVGEQRAQPALLQPAGKQVEDFHVSRVVEIVGDQPDELGALRHQAAREQVWLIAEEAGSVDHLPSRRRRNAGAFGENARHGGDRYPRELRHFTGGDPARRWRAVARYGLGARHALHVLQLASPSPGTFKASPRHHWVKASARCRERPHRRQERRRCRQLHPAGRVASTRLQRTSPPAIPRSDRAPSCPFR